MFEKHDWLLVFSSVCFVVAIVLSLSGCICVDVYTKTGIALDCVNERYPSYCEEAKTDRQKTECLTILKGICIDAAANNKKFEDLVQSPEYEEGPEEKTSNSRRKD